LTVLLDAGWLWLGFSAIVLVLFALVAGLFVYALFFALVHRLEP